MSTSCCNLTLCLFFSALVLYLLQVLATIVLICVNVPLFMLVIGPIVLLYYFIQVRDFYYFVSFSVYV